MISGDICLWCSKQQKDTDSMIKMKWNKKWARNRENNVLHVAMSSYLITAGTSRPDRLAVVSSTEQLLIGPEVDQVHQSLAAVWTHEASGMPQGAMVTCPLSVNSWSLLRNGLLAPSAVLEDGGRRRAALETQQHPVSSSLWQHIKVNNIQKCCFGLKCIGLIFFLFSKKSGCALNILTSTQSGLTNFPNITCVFASIALQPKATMETFLSLNICYYQP